MSDRKQALQDLLAKIEAGDATNDGSMYRAFGDNWTHCYDTFHGSLGAAKALHEAVLPEWDWILTNEAAHAGEPDGPMACVTADDFRDVEISASSETPARAWLCAIIKALIAEEPT